MTVSLPKLFCSHHNWGGELQWDIFVWIHLWWVRIAHEQISHHRSPQCWHNFTLYSVRDECGFRVLRGIQGMCKHNSGCVHLFSCLLYLRFSLKFAIHNTPDTFTIGAKSCLQSSACFNNTGKNVAMIIQNNSCLGCYSCAQNEKGIFTGFSHHHFFEAKLISTLIHFK
jgi:NAD-dependent dihydropyrimidine dehydrogenase PreA subunit